MRENFCNKEFFSYLCPILDRNLIAYTADKVEGGYVITSVLDEKDFGHFLERARLTKLDVEATIAELETLDLMIA